MNLSVPERIVLINLLPREGDFLTLKTLRQTRELLAFDDDAAEYGLKQDANGRVTWEKNTEKDIDLPPRALSIIVEILSDLEKQKKLSEDHFSLYEKFVGE